MKRIIVLGAGGHARVLLDALRLFPTTEIEIIGATDVSPETIDRSKLSCPLLGADEKVFAYETKEVFLVNGLGSIGDTAMRMKLFDNFKTKGYRFDGVIHPSAVLAKDIQLSEGVQIMAGAVVQTGCRIGRNVVINTRASVDHDGIIGDHVFIAPGATLSGGVSVGEHSHVGTGATLIQGCRIGKNCFVNARSIVRENLSDNTLFVEQLILGAPSVRIER